ncbi:hypothetical protein ABK040_002603 [Willaertia magna]
MQDISLDVKEVKIEHGENCLLEENFKLIIKFTNNCNIEKCSWDLKYFVDMTNKRHIIDIGKSETINCYEKDKENIFEYSVDEIHLEGIPKNLLNNVGLLVATLYKEQNEVFKLSMVVQVEKKEDGKLYRTILNPLE